MINILLGPPGGGKSYEAVAFHILPALLSGRMVITNLPLLVHDILDQYPDIDPDLIVIREQTTAERKNIDWKKAGELFKNYGIAARERPFNNYPFSNVEDYSHPWRHPETGSGPFYVIDECHIALPANGTPIAVEHWYSLHRHESADVLLITQSYGKINKSIRDLVQVCYRVRKATALGMEGRYIRKVFDGIRGECVNENIREYDSQYFKLYRSHTLGGGQELKPADIKPLWQHWTFKGAAICAVLVVLIFAFGDVSNPLRPKGLITKNEHGDTVKTTIVNHPVVTPSPAPAPASSSASASAPVDTVTEKTGKYPFDGLGLHLLGSFSNSKTSYWLISVSQNGQRLTDIKSDELEANGLKFHPVGVCSASIEYPDGHTRFITCDSPTVTVSSAASQSS